MDDTFHDFQDFENNEHFTHKKFGKAKVMKRWIQQPSHILICALSALCTLLLLIIILIVIVSNHGVTRTEKNINDKFQNLSATLQSNAEHLSVRGDEMQNIDKSLKRIISEIIRVSSLESDIQRVLWAVGHLSDLVQNNRSADIQDPRCKTGWKHFALSCYYVTSQLRSWSHAKKHCEDQEAHLVVINSQEEQEKMKQITAGLHTWIGLTDVDGQWKWVDGTSYESTPKFWAKDQPDNWYGHGLGGGEDCALLWYRDAWNDDHCSRKFQYICEKEI
ncbi:asialoglycoprotein receptor 1-like [Engystomops pustulosus]|uniref:asialoglycoprotein receptor 1-like n=1 Tax=Engystomops pustulosus TaxID=76066 RepID=UPI003AFB13A4